jgi:Ni/Fe-hydrogenase subunit HybB-like protein
MLFAKMYDSSVISFVAMLRDFSCCDEKIDLRFGLWTTIPFFLLVMLEMVLLGMTIRRAVFPKEADRNTHERLRLLLTMLNAIILLNPFFGFLMGWMLLFQSSVIGESVGNDLFMHLIVECN